MRYRQRMGWGAFVLLAVTGGFAAGSSPGEAVPLEILEPAERAETVKEFPVSLGLIFLEGEVASAHGGAVLDDLGSAIPFDSEVTGWWSPEKESVKWLLLHFKASSDRNYSFVLGAQPARPQGRPLAVESRGGVVVDTGPLEVRLARARELLAKARIAR
jgi:hypothetical protein